MRACVVSYCDRADKQDTDDLTNICGPLNKIDQKNLTTPKWYKYPHGFEDVFHGN